MAVFVDPAEVQGITPEQQALYECLAALARRSRVEAPGDIVAAMAATVAGYRQDSAQPHTVSSFAAMGPDIFADITRRWQQQLDTGRPCMGHSTGFPRLDDLLGGLEPGRITLLLAGPGTGKTAFSNQLAYTLAASGVPVLYCSYENAALDLGLKQVARLSGKRLSDIKRGYVSPDDLASVLTSEHAQIAGSRLNYLECGADTGPDTLDLLLEDVKTTAPGVPPVVILDYLQAMARASGRLLGEDMRTRTGNVSRLLIDVAKRHGAHVWAISSVSRGQGAKNGKYGGDIDMGRAKESGDLEFDADHVLGLTVEEGGVASSATLPINLRSHTPMKLRVDKNRHGNIGDISLLRNPETLEYTSPEPDTRFLGTSIAMGFAYV